jgi:hypothetical protein
MFVMTNDGGLPENVNNMSTAPVFVQRAFLLELLSRGLPIVLLKGAEYRNSKVNRPRRYILHICHADHIV